MGQLNRKTGLLFAALLCLVAIYAITAIVARASFSALLPASEFEQSAAPATFRYASLLRVQDLACEKTMKRLVFPT